MKINIPFTDLRLRKDHSTKSASLGFATSGLHEVLETYNGSDYKWYRIAQGWVAGVDGVTEESEEVWAQPQPVERDRAKDQLYVGDVTLRIRAEASTSGAMMGYCKSKSYYNVLEVVSGAYYKWYKIGDKAYCAGVEEVDYLPVQSWERPEPVESNENLNQIYVGNITLNIRSGYSTSSEKMGVCSKNSYYNVIEKKNANGYTWYKLGEESWVAGVDEVIYYTAGMPRNINELKAKVSELISSLGIAQKSIEKMLATEHYKDLLEKATVLNDWIAERFDPVDYDIVDTNDYDEIDLVYTTDIHGYAKGYEESQRVQTNFSWSDLEAYKNKLLAKNIKPLFVNCGDIIHGSSRANANHGEDIVRYFNNIDMFASVFGNHEFRYNDDGPWFQARYGKIMSATACNLLNKKTGKPAFKPYRTAKIGSKRIGIIGIGFPGFDGGHGNLDEYEILTGDACYQQVQKYINELKDLNMDYIFALVHLGTAPDARANSDITVNSIVENTRGLDMICPGHSHSMSDQEYVIDKGGKRVAVAAQPRCDLMYISRIRIKDSGITSSLISSI